MSHCIFKNICSCCCRLHSCCCIMFMDCFLFCFFFLEDSRKHAKKKFLYIFIYCNTLTLAMNINCKMELRVGNGFYVVVTNNGERYTHAYKELMRNHCTSQKMNPKINWGYVQLLKQRKIIKLSFCLTYIHEIYIFISS